MAFALLFLIHLFNLKLQILDAYGGVDVIQFFQQFYLLRFR